MADLADDATPIEFMIHEAMSNLPQVPEHTGTCLLLHAANLQLVHSAQPIVVTTMKKFNDNAKFEDYR
jgi:hypothetical protein